MHLGEAPVFPEAEGLYLHILMIPVRHIMRDIRPTRQANTFCM